MFILNALLEGVKAILHLLAICLKIVYNVLKIFRIRLLTLYLLVCGAIQLIWHPIGRDTVWFWVFLGVFCLFTLLSWVVWFKKRFGGRDRRVVETAPARDETSEPEMPLPKRREKPREPVWFEAEGHPGYFFAEYEDRYELYRRTENGNEYVRTDFKGGSR